MERQKVTLDVLTIAEPCTEDWDGMRGDEQVRFCGLCHRNVYNLSAMTREQADEVLSTHEDRVCVRFYKRADGTVTTSDCTPDRLAAARRKARRALVWTGVMAGGFLTMIGLAGVASLYGYHEMVMEHKTGQPPCEIPSMGAAVAEPPALVDPPPPEEPAGPEVPTDS